MSNLPKNNRIWIDLDNSPHVPFFFPIVRELRQRGFQTLLTARDCSQTCGLADLFCMDYQRIGKHYGKNKMLKVAGTILRGLQLSRVIKGDKPILALSHGSRSQMVSAYLLRIPSVVIMDYEYTQGFVRPDWIIMPEVILVESIKFNQNHVLKYPGIKEDVYVPYFKPDASIKADLKLNAKDVIVTVRPPATEAHYHNPESEKLFSEAVHFLGQQEDVRMVILPRYDAQIPWIKNQWPKWCSNGKIIIPDQVVNGLNLIWFSDLVISGGGTMNREAAALGVPVYSIFRGKIGAVDRYLSDKGRLILIESVEDIGTKISLKKRLIPDAFESRSNPTLNSIIESIIKLIKN